MTWPRPAICVLAALCAGAVAGCGLSPAPPTGELWTVPKLIAAARDNSDELGAQLIALRGATLPLLSAPFGPGATQAPDSDGLQIFAAFSEGRPAAYTTTEVWNEFPKVWVQPLYLLVTGFDGSSGAPQFLGAAATFSVGTGSRFYSPFWQIYYTVVPPGTPLDLYTSEKKILDDKLPLVKGATTLCVITPHEVSLAHAPGARPQRPLTNEELTARADQPGWVEGEKIWYVDFGRNRFRYDDHLVVQETALFQFAVRNPLDGSKVPLLLPKVGGTGPLHQPRTPEVIGGIPQFGSLWHQYTVLLNPTRSGLPFPAFFVPPGQQALAAKVVALAGDARWASTPPAAFEAQLSPAQLARYPEFALRVLADPAQCYANAPLFPDGLLPDGTRACPWLDSQKAIETSVSAELIELEDEDQLSNCPFLLFNGLVMP